MLQGTVPGCCVGVLVMIRPALRPPRRSFGSRAPRAHGRPARPPSPAPSQPAPRAADGIIVSRAKQPVARGGRTPHGCAASSSGTAPRSPRSGVRAHATASCSRFASCRSACAASFSAWTDTTPPSLVRGAAGAGPFYASATAGGARGCRSREVPFFKRPTGGPCPVARAPPSDPRTVPGSSCRSGRPSGTWASACSRSWWTGPRSGGFAAMVAGVMAVAIPTRGIHQGSSGPRRAGRGRSSSSSSHRASGPRPSRSPS